MKRDSNKRCIFTLMYTRTYIFAVDVRTRTLSIGEFQVTCRHLLRSDAALHGENGSLAEKRSTQRANEDAVGGCGRDRSSAAIQKRDAIS